MPRQRLLKMRRTLLDKCEELINSEQWPHGAQNLRTAKIFKDLLQFCGTESSIFSDAQGLTHHSSFVPAVSQRSLLLQSIDSAARDVSLPNDMKTRKLSQQPLQSPKVNNPGHSSVSTMVQNSSSKHTYMMHYAKKDAGTTIDQRKLDTVITDDASLGHSIGRKLSSKLQSKLP